MTSTMAEYEKHYRRLDEMIAQSSEENLAECAGLLALNVAEYKRRYGELPLAEHQAMLETDQIDEGVAKLLASGMLEMTMTLAVVTGRSEEYKRLKAEGSLLQ